jgi:hypothetical protein
MNDVKKFIEYIEHIDHAMNEQKKQIERLEKKINILENLPIVDGYVEDCSKTTPNVLNKCVYKIVIIICVGHIDIKFMVDDIRVAFEYKTDQHHLEYYSNFETILQLCESVTNLEVINFMPVDHNYNVVVENILERIFKFYPEIKMDENTLNFINLYSQKTKI